MSAQNAGCLVSMTERSRMLWGLRGVRYLAQYVPIGTQTCTVRKTLHVCCRHTGRVILALHPGLAYVGPEGSYSEDLGVSEQRQEMFMKYPET